MGEVKGYLWMPQRSAEATREVGGAMPKRKCCVLCLITFLGEASKICEVVTK